MLARIIFCIAVIAATLVVLLLAFLSPVAHRKASKTQTSRPWLALSLYIQQAPVAPSRAVKAGLPQAAGAFVFRRTLTEGPENTSRVVGRAQGFIIPIENFAHSDFNVIYLTFDTPEFSGSLGVQAKLIGHKNREELTVVGGTGSFAFARGIAVFAQTDRRPDDVDGAYHVKLQLSLPNQSHPIPGR